MRVVLQRVSRASVTVGDTVVGEIGRGVLLLVGVHLDDTVEQANYLAAKCIDLRIFPDDDGKMNLSLDDVKGEVLVVSQFTLCADCGKGRRPSFVSAAPPEKGERLYEYFVERLRMKGLTVRTGMFGAMMHVELVNDGPVTLILDR